MLKYIREFDSIRAFSVLAVMIQHYFGQFGFLSVLGSSGVTMFFVLSGYLITQILLKEKEVFNIEAGRNFEKSGFVLKTFYIRRALRIFPIYYITLFLLAILNVDSAREYLAWHGLYLSNFLYSFKIGMDSLSHFWSLGVEEQFYLAWPFMILCMPFKWNNTRFFLLLILGSVLFKFWMGYLYSFESLAPYFLMPSCIEAFAFGAIAILMAKQKINSRLLSVLMIASLLLFLAMQVAMYKNYSYSLTVVCAILSRTVFSFFGCTVLVAIVNGLHKGIIKTILNSSVLVLLGKMSYGIYIYHHFVPGLLTWLQHISGVSLQGTGVLMPLNFIVSFAIAYASYRWIEVPVNGLKKKFAYK